MRDEYNTLEILQAECIGVSAVICFRWFGRSLYLAASSLYTLAAHVLCFLCPLLLMWSCSQDVMGSSVFSTCEKSIIIPEYSGVSL